MADFRDGLSNKRIIRDLYPVAAGATLVLDASACVYITLVLDSSSSTDSTIERCNSDGSTTYGDAIALTGTDETTAQAIAVDWPFWKIVGGTDGLTVGVV